MPRSLVMISLGLIAPRVSASVYVSTCLIISDGNISYSLLPASGWNVGTCLKQHQEELPVPCTEYISVMVSELLSTDEDCSPVSMSVLNQLKFSLLFRIHAKKILVSTVMVKNTLERLFHV